MVNWEALGAIAEGLSALGVIATLAYLAVQIRQNGRLLASSLQDSVRNGLNEPTRIIAADREAAGTFWAGLENREALGLEERRQFDALVTLTFYGQQQAFVNGMLDLAALQWMLSWPGTHDWWKAYSATFSGDFRDYVDRAIRAQASSRSTNHSTSAPPSQEPSGSAR